MSGRSPGDWEADGHVIVMSRYAASPVTIAVAVREEDAPFLAASADLFDALEEILNYSGGADNALEDENVMNRARHAYAKAREG